MKKTVKKESPPDGIYPTLEAMPSNYRKEVMCSKEDITYKPSKNELGHELYYNQLTQEGKKHLAKLMSYENKAVVIRFAEDQKMPIDIAEKIFHGLKQYLAVCVLVGGKHTPAKVIDECWHTFLLHSRDYVNFCNEYTRGFIHHDPAIDDSGFSFYSLTRQAVINLFGKVNEEVWPLKHKRYSRCVSTKDSEAPRFIDFCKN